MVGDMSDTTSKVDSGVRIPHSIVKLKAAFLDQLECSRIAQEQCKSLETSIYEFHFSADWDRLSHAG